MEAGLSEASQQSQVSSMPKCFPNHLDQPQQHHLPSGENSMCQEEKNIQSDATLTKRLLNLFCNAEDGVVELDAAVERLQASRRELCEIIDALEGIEVLERFEVGSNSSSTTDYMYQSGSSRTAYALRISKLLVPGQIDAALIAARAEEEHLDQLIFNAKRLLQQSGAKGDSPQGRSELFIEAKDLNKLCGGFWPKTKQTLIAVHGKAGRTVIDIPHPDDGIDQSLLVKRRYQMFIRSSPGAPLNVVVTSTTFGAKDRNDESQIPLSDLETEKTLSLESGEATRQRSSIVSAAGTLSNEMIEQLALYAKRALDNELTETTLSTDSFHTSPQASPETSEATATFSPLTLTSYKESLNKRNNPKGRQERRARHSVANLLRQLMEERLDSRCQDSALLQSGKMVDSHQPREHALAETNNAPAEATEDSNIGDDELRVGSKEHDTRNVKGPSDGISHTPIETLWPKSICLENVVESFRQAPGLATTSYVVGDDPTMHPFEIIFDDKNASTTRTIEEGSTSNHETESLPQYQTEAKRGAGSGRKWALCWDSVEEKEYYVHLKSRHAQWERPSAWLDFVTSPLSSACENEDGSTILKDDNPTQSSNVQPGTRSSGPITKQRSYGSPSPQTERAKLGHDKKPVAQTSENTEFNILSAGNNRGKSSRYQGELTSFRRSGRKRKKTLKARSSSFSSSDERESLVDSSQHDEESEIGNTCDTGQVLRQEGEQIRETTKPLNSPPQATSHQGNEERSGGTWIASQTGAFYGKEVLGERLRMYWGHPWSNWFEGLATDYSPALQQHTIAFEDGDVQKLELHQYSLEWWVTSQSHLNGDSRLRNVSSPLPGHPFSQIDANHDLDTAAAANKEHLMPVMDDTRTASPSVT